LKRVHAWTSKSRVRAWTSTHIETETVAHIDASKWTHTVAHITYVHRPRWAGEEMREREDCDLRKWAGAVPGRHRLHKIVQTTISGPINSEFCIESELCSYNTMQKNRNMPSD